MRQFLKIFFSLITLNRLLWFFIFVGVFLRVVQYSLDRSLWIDEAFLALNIINRPLTKLLEPLDYNQGAPVGFVLIETIVVQIFGNSEYALRLFPFLSGIASIFLFARVAKWFSSLPVAVIALGLFALCDRAIYYSAELKQYSSDLALALLIYLMIINLRSSKLTFWQITFFAIFGAIVIWFSHPSIFVLGGTGITLLIVKFLQRDWPRVIKYSIVFFCWLLSFIAFYKLSLQQIGSNEALQKSWDANHDSFAPLPPLSFTDLRWYFDTFLAIFNYPIGLYLTGIAVLAFLIGFLSLWKSNKEKLFLLISPIILSLLASGLQKYPFKGQLLLFIIPLMLLIVSEGTQQIIESARSKSKPIGITFLILLFFHPLYYAVWNLRFPQYPLYFEYQRVREDIKPVLNYIRKKRKNGDVFYLYYAAQYAFAYYSKRYGFNYEQLGKPVRSQPPKDWFAPALSSYPPQLIVGQYSRDKWSVFETELDRLQGNKRVWIIFSHVRDRRSSIDEEDVFLALLDRAGTKLDSFNSTEASVYLYDLTKNFKLK